MLTKLYQAVALIGLMAIISLASGTKGYLLGAEHQDAKDADAAHQLQTQIDGRLTADKILLASLTSQLTDARRDSGNYYGKWQDELLKHKTDLTSAAAPGAAPQPLPVLSNYAVCMWDRANARIGELPGGPHAGSIDDDAGACAAAPASSGASGFDLFDAISSHGDDAADCAFNAQELSYLLDFEAGRKANAAKFKTGAPP